MFHIVIKCAHYVSRSNEYAFNVPQGSYQLITHQQHYTVITVIYTVQCIDKLTVRVCQFMKMSRS